MSAKVQTQLLQSLESNASLDDVLDVVLYFDRPMMDARPESVPVAEWRQQMARVMAERIEQTLEHASSESGRQPEIKVSFPALGSASIRADRSYLKALLDQPEVLGAEFNKSAR
jgi:hypothetical protein